MFTLFLAGNTYAPNTMVDGLPIQDFLQSRYIQAFVVLAQGIQAADATLWDETILGFDTMNEPNGGFIGTEDIRILPKHTLKKGAAPTFLESARACMGMTTRVKKFSFGLMGIRAKGTTTIRPEGASCWLPGRNVWLNEGVHDEHGNALLPEYFSTDGDADAWMQRFWLPFAERFSGAIRKVVPDAIIFAEGEAVRAPPRWPDAARQNVVFSPHYYDGLTLMQKRMPSVLCVMIYMNNADMRTLLEFRMFNADGYAVVKGENPIRSLGFGYAQVTDALTRSLKGIKEDGMRRWGMVPCLIGEIGIPCRLQRGWAKVRICMIEYVWTCAFKSTCTTVQPTPQTITPSSGVPWRQT